MLKRGFNYIIYFVCTVGITVFVNSCNTESKTESRTVFRYNESQGIASLDPAFARNQVVIWPVHQLFNGLVQLNDSLHVEPCIAKSWSVLDNGTLYRFNLRNDVFFHNNDIFPNGKGRKVIAGDFEYSFNRILDGKTASPGRWIFANIDTTDGKGFVAINDTVLQIRLKQAFPAFLGILTMQYCSVLPYEVVERLGEDFGKHPVGTGPFQFKYWKEGEKLIFVKNKNYFEQDSAGNTLPYLDAVSISFVPDKQSEFLEFIKGEIDFLNHIHKSYKNELLTPSGSLNPKYNGKLKMYKGNYLNTEYLAIYLGDKNDLALNNPLYNKKIRYAINMGFDRRKMLKYLRNNIGDAAQAGFIPKGLPGYVEGWGMDYNPDSARTLVKLAEKEMGSIPPITITTTTAYRDLIEFIQHDLADIGLNVEIEVSVGATFRSMIANSKLPFFRASWIADYPDAENYLSLFYSKNFCPSGPNYTHFKSSAFDRLYEQALLEVDAAKRLEMYHQMDRLIMDQAPIVPLFYDQVVRFTHTNIEGMTVNPLNLLVLKNVRKVK